MTWDGTDEGGCRRDVGDAGRQATARGERSADLTWTVCSCHHSDSPMGVTWFVPEVTEGRSDDIMSYQMKREVWFVPSF